jgi:nitrogen-specific signal transduction histidine kinase
MKNKDKISEAINLRNRAEELLKIDSSKTKQSHIEVDLVKLIHELEVYQVELEMQKEELIDANIKAELAVKNYYELFEFTPACYFSLSKDGDIINLNKSSAQLLGKERNILINSRFGFFISDDSKPVFSLFLRNAFDSGTRQSCEVKIVTDIHKPLFIYVIGLVTKDGKSCNLNIIDITEQKQEERKMKDLLEKLTISNRELESFAYVASHDLQEPLRMVTSFMQLLAQQYGDKLDSKAHEYINFAVDGAKRLFDLLNGLLSYSRIQTRGQTFTLVDANIVLNTVLKNLALVISEKNAVIESDRLPVLHADETQLVQLFQNIIANGIKFSNNTPRIYISFKFDIDHYLFSIKDEGIGIEPQYFVKIFEIFQRLMPRDQYDGIGIGLALCRRIVERHGGKIWVESEPGNGSTFYFTIHNDLPKTVD